MMPINYAEDVSVNLSFHAFSLGYGCRRNGMDTGWRRLPAPLIEIPNGGNWELMLEGDDTPLQINHGEALVVPTGVPHKLIARCSGAMTSIFALAGFRWILDLDVISLARIPVKLPPAAGVNLEPLLTEMVGIWGAGCERMDGAVRLHELGFTLLGELLAYAEQKVWWQETPDLSRVGKALEIIRSRPNAEHSCRTLATKTGLSPSRFNAVFRKAVGAAPKVFMRNLRLRRACETLARGDLPVYAVAEACGFNSSYYFCRLFTKHIGMSPSAFRKTFAADRRVPKYTNR